MWKFVNGIRILYYKFPHITQLLNCLKRSVIMSVRVAVSDALGGTVVIFTMGAGATTLENRMYLN